MLLFRKAPYGSALGVNQNRHPSRNATLYFALLQIELLIRSFGMTVFIYRYIFASVHQMFSDKK